MGGLYESLSLLGVRRLAFGCEGGVAPNTKAGDWSVIREIIPDCTDTQPSASEYDAIDDLIPY